MNTKEYKWLAYGPGLLEGDSIGSPTELIIQARNNNDENRTSERDHFIVEIVKVGEKQKPIECKLVDNDNDTYTVTYQIDEPWDVKIDIQIENDKQKIVPIRGTPYSENFSDKSRGNNELTGSIMLNYNSKLRSNHRVYFSNNERDQFQRQRLRL